MNVTSKYQDSFVPTPNNETTSYWDGFNQKVGNVTGNVFNAFAPIFDKVHSLLGTVLPRKINKPAFDRGEGYWSKPEDEAIKSIFGRLTDINSQRENWYKVTPYIAEFWCAVSNAGLIYVGLQHNSPELIFAGAASAVSHSIPKQWLLTVDKIGVFVVLTKLAREYEVLVNNPWLVAPIAAAGVINLMDAHISREKGETWPHVVWHLSTATIADLFLRFSTQ